MMFKFQYDKQAVGRRVALKRNAAGLTQEKLAEKIEKSVRTIADIERGAAGMSMETLFILCNALETTPNELLLPPGDTDDAGLVWLLQVLNNSPEHVRATAIEIAKVYLRSVE